MPEPVTGTILALAAARAFGGGAGKQVAGRVADLVGLANAQRELLEGIRRDVTAPVQGPQRAALVLLTDAASAKAPETQAELLREARRELVRAVGQETDDLRHSYARVESVVALRVIGVGEARLVQYLAATKPARKCEQNLVEVHAYVRGLRHLLISRGEAEDSIALYEPRLEPAASVTLQGTTSTFWGLALLEVASGGPAAPADQPILLSDGRPRTEVQIRRRGSLEWQSTRSTSAPHDPRRPVA